MNTKLSICIPTYNRANFIEETLKSLIPQAKKYNIPIYISDNGSTDNTLYILNKYKIEIYKYIFFRKNLTNLGFDNNLFEVVSMANTEFCWLFGDDDIIEDSSIELLLKQIDLNLYKLFILNYSTYDSNLSTKIEEKHIPILVDSVYMESEYDKLLTDLFVYSTFIGSLVVNRKLWIFEARKYSARNFIHNTSAFNYIIGKKSLFLTKSIVRNRLGNTDWVNNSFRVWYSEWQKNIFQLDNRYYNSVKKFRREMSDISIKGMLFHRAKKEYNYSIYLEFIRYEPKISYLRKKMLLLISLFPVTFLKYFYLIYLYIYKPQSYKFLIYSLK